LVGKPEMKKLRSGCEDNIKMDHKEIGYDGADWIYIVPDKDQ
jgi:hypothetical protein